jgi:hypothetical protein
MRHKYSSLSQGHSLAYGYELSNESSNPFILGVPKLEYPQIRCLSHVPRSCPRMPQATYIGVIPHFQTPTYQMAS